MREFFSFLILIGLLVIIFTLRRKNQRLEGFRQDLVASVSHEFRTPLSIIKGYTETLLSKGSLSRADEVQFLERVRESSDRLIKMVEDLLHVTRLESIGTGRGTTLIHLMTFFEMFRSRFEKRLQEKNLQWFVELKPPLENIESQEGLLEIVVNNLVDNAIKYSTEEGGKITVRGERRGSHIQFCVQDEGIGIVPHQQGLVFNRFHRVNPRTSEGGAGLGLSVVKHAVSSLGGRVWVESEMGKGSRFFFTVRPS